MLRRLIAKDAIEFGEAIARRLAERYPPALDKPGAPQISADRLSRILEGLYAEAQHFNAQHKLGFYRRARLCHAFKWRLMELGYSKAFVNVATEGLVIYLSKTNTQPSPTRIRTSGNDTGAK